MVLHKTYRRGRCTSILDVLTDGFDGGQLELTDRVSKMLGTEEPHHGVIFPYGGKYSLLGAFCAVHFHITGHP